MSIGNITLGGLTFVNRFSDAGGSYFIETSRGPTKPTEIVIKHLAIKEGRTKRPALQSSITVNRYDELADGEIAIVESTSMTCRVITDPGVSDAEVTLGAELIVQLLTGTGADASALNKKTAILVSHDQ